MTRLVMPIAIVAIGCASSSDSSSAAREPRPAVSEPTPTPSASPLASPEPEPEREPAAPPEPAPGLEIDAMGVTGAHSTSVGGPSNGTLEGAVPLPPSGPGLRSNPERPNRTGYWGTVEMVQELVRAAAVVNRELPGGELTINDLSLRHGGVIPHHGSHQSGRDVDVLFYLLDADGAPRRGKGVPIDPEGRGTDFGDLVDPEDDADVRLDVPRTWRFLQALVEDEHSTMQRIFVVEHVRTMLLDHARRVRAPARARQRVDQMTCQPGSPHDDHLHIRFFCTAEDIAAGCEDTYPLYGWRRRAMRALGVEPVIARHPRRTRDVEARTVSRREAREAAGEMHATVRRFLDRRESWADKPSPGRPFCP